MNSPKSLSPYEVSGNLPASLSGSTPTNASLAFPTLGFKATDALLTRFGKAPH